MAVFPQGGYARLYDSVAAAVAAGGPAVHLDSYPVAANSYHAIPGGWNVSSLSGWNGCFPSTVCASGSPNSPSLLTNSRALTPPDIQPMHRQVTVLWVMNARMGEWEAALPQDVRRRLGEVAAQNRSAGGGFILAGASLALQDRRINPTTHPPTHHHNQLPPQHVR
jgi:hypothetical protein